MTVLKLFLICMFRIQNLAENLTNLVKKKIELEFVFSKSDRHRKVTVGWKWNLAKGCTPQIEQFPPVLLSSCPPVLLSSCPLVFLSSCLPVFLSPCPHVFLVACPLILLSSCSLLSCPYINTSCLL